MLVEFGCEYVITGHSERRNRGHDTDFSAGERFKAAEKAGMKPVFCVGETLEEYEAGLTASVTVRQLNAVLEQVGAEGLSKGVLAYEPIWAIGTGNSASPAHAQIILRFLREHIAVSDPAVAENMLILYGGSMKADNAGKLFSMPDIDGGLVGGASLVTEDFVAICKAASMASAA
jgi:triosephosphate isomerase